MASRETHLRLAMLFMSYCDRLRDGASWLIAYRTLVALNVYIRAMGLRLAFFEIGPLLRSFMSCGRRTFISCHSVAPYSDSNASALEWAAFFIVKMVRIGAHV